MQVGNLINIGVQGFQNATAKAAEAAQNIASQSVTDSIESVNASGQAVNGSGEAVSSSGINTADITSSLVQLKQAEIDAVANAKVIEAGSDLVGSLLDITV